MPEKHALLSASSAYRWTQCTPSARINAIFPEVTSSAAEEGRKLHDQAEKILKGEIINAGDLVMAYTEYVTRTLKTYSAKEPTKLLVEKMIDFSQVAPEGFGTADAVIINNSILHIVDFKSGSQPVIAKNNMQLVLYLAGAINSMSYRGSKLRATIVQPKAFENPQTWELDIVQLDQILLSIKPIAKLAYEGKGTFKAGDHCIFCKFKEKCPEHNKYFKNVYEF